MKDSVTLIKVNNLTVEVQEKYVYKNHTCSYEIC